MGKYLNWLKKNILNENESEKVKEIDECSEAKYSVVEERKQREKIYISHMDDYFWDAGRFIIEKNKASIGMLQRVFKIGFNRAAKIMDELYEAGIVGEEIGTAPRKVLINQNEFDELQNDDLIEVKEGMEAENKHKDQSIYTIKDIETILRVSFGIDADYSSDGRTLETLKNFIVPSVSSENQTKIIDTLLKYNSPIAMRLILMDDSIINYSQYNAVPHMLIPVITSDEKYDSVIRWCYAEMQDRINKFVENGVKNIDSFNKKMINTGEKTCPKIIFVINEISSFLKCAKMPLEKIFLNCSMTGIYFIMFSRFSAKNLSLGRLSELFEISTFDKLKTLLSQGGKIESEQITKINYDDMNGYQFEQFCADILGKNGFENIELTQGSGDHGIDILAEKDNVAYAIQCKCYSSNIGNAAVQQAHTGKSLYHKDIAVVMTNRYFTTQAIEEAGALGVKLWDRDYLNNIINGTSIRFDVKYEDKRDISKDELYKTQREIAIKISNVLKSFQINAPIVDINYSQNETVFCIQPPQNISLNSILSYKEKIESELRIPVRIRMIPGKYYIGIFILSNDLEKYERIKNNEAEEKISNAIIEKYYYINGDFTTFSLKKEKKIEILGICHTEKSAANLYLGLTVRLKEEYAGKIGFSVAVDCNGKTAVASNENGEDFFGGKEENGEFVAGIPKWMEKARDDLLNSGQIEFLNGVKEVNTVLDEFIEISIKNIE